MHTGGSFLCVAIHMQTKNDYVDTLSPTDVYEAFKDMGITGEFILRKIAQYHRWAQMWPFLAAAFDLKSQKDAVIREGKKLQKARIKCAYRDAAALFARASTERVPQIEEASWVESPRHLHCLLIGHSVGTMGGYNARVY